MRELFRQFSFPGGIPSHVAPETPGSIHEGGELGYALAHAFGAAFDNPDLVVACVVGDGEAETGPARDELAREQVPQRAHRRRRAPGAAAQRLQDREPDRARPDPGGRARLAAGGLRLAAHRRRRGRAGSGAPGLRGRARRGARRDPRDPASRAKRRGHEAPAMADARPAYAEGLDRPQGGRRPADGGHLALPPGADHRRPEQSRPPAPARGLDAQLPARGALRRGRPPRAPSSPSFRRAASCA